MRKAFLVALIITVSQSSSAQVNGPSFGDFFRAGNLHMLLTDICRHDKQMYAGELWEMNGEGRKYSACWSVLGPREDGKTTINYCVIYDDKRLDLQKCKLIQLEEFWSNAKNRYLGKEDLSALAKEKKGIATRSTKILGWAHVFILGMKIELHTEPCSSNPIMRAAKYASVEGGPLLDACWEAKEPYHRNMQIYFCLHGEAARGCSTPIFLKSFWSDAKKRYLEVNDLADAYPDVFKRGPKICGGGLSCAR